MKHKPIIKYFRSDISGKSYPLNQKMSLMSIRESIVDLIKLDYPDIDESMSISISELEEYRRKYIKISLTNQMQNISSLEQEVIEKIQNRELISLDSDDEIAQPLTFGQRIADKVATFGGSWKFIICFFLLIFFWIILNLTSLLFKSFDPYPFILLNLLLSCLAAIQAPIIMMSQNRVEERDRIRAKADYKINLKAEIEIQTLHDKIDFLITQQQQKLFEFQDIQVEMLNEITNHIVEERNSKNKE